MGWIGADLEVVGSLQFLIIIKLYIKICFEISRTKRILTGKLFHKVLEVVGKGNSKDVPTLAGPGLLGFFWREGLNSALACTPTGYREQCLPRPVLLQRKTPWCCPRTSLSVWMRICGAGLRRVERSSPFGTAWLMTKGPGPLIRGNERCRQGAASPLTQALRRNTTAQTVTLRASKT